MRAALRAFGWTGVVAGVLLGVGCVDGALPTEGPQARAAVLGAVKSIWGGVAGLEAQGTLKVTLGGMLPPPPLQLGWTFRGVPGKWAQLDLADGVMGQRLMTLDAQVGRSVVMVLAAPGGRGTVYEGHAADLAPLLKEAGMEDGLGQVMLEGWTELASGRDPLGGTLDDAVWRVSSVDAGQVVQVDGKARHRWLLRPGTGFPHHAELRRHRGTTPTLVVLDFLEPHAFENPVRKLMVPWLVNGVVKADCPGEPMRARFILRINAARGALPQRAVVDAQGARPLKDALAHPLVKTAARTSAQVKSSMATQCR